MPFVASFGGAMGYGRAFKNPISNPVLAQWATKIGGTWVDDVRATAIDSLGNVYVTGLLNTNSGVAVVVTINNFSSAPINSGAVGITPYGTLTSREGGSMFLVKYNPSGSVIWATKIDSNIGRAEGRDIIVDIDDNVIVTGSFSSTITINSYLSPPVSQGEVGLRRFGTLTSNTGTNMMIIKYNSAGTAQWATNAQSTESIGRGIAVDADKNIIVGGIYQGQCMFNSFGSAPGGGGAIVVTPYGFLQNTGSTDMFVVKYSPGGSIIWVTRVNSIAADTSLFSVATDISGNVYLHTNYNNTVTINSSVLTPIAPGSQINLTAYGTLTCDVINNPDICIVKFDPSGSVIWATKMGGLSIQQSFDITTDSSGSVYVTGEYTGNLTINSFLSNPSSAGGSINLTSYGFLQLLSSSDAFVVKFNSAGTALWATRIAGTSGSTRGTAIVCDQYNSVYVVGFYNGTTIISNFSTPPATGASSVGLVTYGTLTSQGNTDGFIVKYSTNGVAQWATTLGGSSSSDQIQSVVVSPDGYLYVSGNFGSTTLIIKNFISPPTSGGAIGLSIYGTLSLTGSQPDIFFVKYGPI